MFPSSRKGGTPGIYEVNMTPLIDVSLVLVVILMVATPMALQSSITVRNTAASGRTAAQKSRAERIEITILSPDSLIVNRTHVGRQALRGTLHPLLASSATQQVVIRCARGVTHGDFVGVLDDTRSCGTTQIAVLGR